METKKKHEKKKDYLDWGDIDTNSEVTPRHSEIFLEI